MAERREDHGEKEEFLMEKTFQIGSFSFRLKFPEELVLPVDMEKFLAETDSADYTYIITAVDILPEAEGELIRCV